MKVRMRKHPNNRYRVAAIDIPTFCGALRVTGVGDVFSDALGNAVKVASRIVDDPIMRAIMPPEATVAIDAVRNIAAASRQGPAALREVMQDYTGPGQQRLIAALKREGSSRASASSDNVYRGVGPDPSVRYVGAPPLPAGQSSRGSSVTVTQTNPQGGRVTRGPQYGGQKGVATDQRTSAPPGFTPGKGWDSPEAEQAYFDSLHSYGKGKPQAPDTSQQATDAELYHPGDYLPPPAPGKQISPAYQAQLDAEASDPNNPYTQSDEYADYYATNYPELFGGDADQQFGYDPYGGGGYAYPDNGYDADQAAIDQGARWAREQAAADELDERGF